MRSGQHWSLIIKQAMDENMKELDQSDQELEGSPIAGEISSVNHRSPSSSAPPTEGKVQLSDKQKAKKKVYDHRHYDKKKRQEGLMIDRLDNLENTTGELERGSDELKRERDHLEGEVKESWRILCQLLDNNAGQNTEVQNLSQININGESSMGLNDQREMNQVPITSSTFSGENPSMNPPTLPQSAKKKRKIIEAPERIQILLQKNVKLEEDKAVFIAEARLLRITLAMLDNIRARLTSETARRTAMMGTCIMDYVLQNSGQGSTPFNTQLQLLLELIGFGTRETGPPVHQPPVYQSGTTMRSGGPTIEEPLGLPQSHLPQGWEHGSTSFNTQLQLQFEMIEFDTGPTGLPIHHPPVYQSGTTMGSRGPVIEESLGLPQSHILQGWTHSQLPSGMTPDNIFSTGEAGLPVHHPLDYQYGTTMGSGGSTIENPMGLPQSHVSQGWTHGNQGLEIDGLTFSLSDLSCFDNEETQELETKSS
uniref:BZIP domain-containing protein n=1 Tax=Populus davidiana TaxID=266767 RepID=A0A6M2EJS1_9ROSI